MLCKTSFETIIQLCDQKGYRWDLSEKSETVSDVHHAKLHSVFLTAMRAVSDCSKLCLWTREEDDEEEVTMGLAVAKENEKNGTEGFSWWKRYFCFTTNWLLQEFN